MKQLSLFVLIVSMLCSCNKSSDICDPGGIVHEFTEPTTGVVDFDKELNLYSIRYHVPGTIDSFLIGYLCNPDVEFELTDRLLVEFTGNFRDIGDFSPLTMIGESDYFHLELLSITLPEELDI